MRRKCERFKGWGGGEKEGKATTNVNRSLSSASNSIPFWFPLLFFQELQQTSNPKPTQRWQVPETTVRRLGTALERCRRRGSTRRKCLTRGVNYLTVHWNWPSEDSHLWPYWATSHCTLTRSPRPAPSTLPKSSPASLLQKTPILPNRFSFWVFIYFPFFPFLVHILWTHYINKSNVRLITFMFFF